MVGVWKDFDDLESSLSLEELFVVLDAYRKKIYDDRKFLAAIQGIDIEKNAPQRSDHEERMAAMLDRVNKRIGNDNAPPADVAGFLEDGIEYEVIT